MFQSVSSPQLHVAQRFQNVTSFIKTKKKKKKKRMAGEINRVIVIDSLLHSQGWFVLNSGKLLIWKVYYL